MEINVGKIILNYKEKILVALAVYEGFYCTKFFLRVDWVEEIYNKSASHLMIPDILSDKGLLGTGLDYYKFLSNNNNSGRDWKILNPNNEIIFEPLISISKNQLELLLNEIKKLELKT